MDSKYEQDLEKFITSKNKLNDNDIKSICEIYWLDYLCFPFNIPKTM